MVDHASIILSIIGTFFGENYAGTLLRIIGRFYRNTGQYDRVIIVYTFGSTVAWCMVNYLLYHSVYR